MATLTTADIDSAFDLLAAGYPGNNPTIDDTTANVWHYGLSRFTPAVVVASATTWPQRHERFPSLTEFISHCQETARAMLKAEEESKERGTKTCPVCDGTGWVFINDTGHGTVDKCRTCRRLVNA